MPNRTADKTDFHVGQRIRMRRLMLKISQAELGDQLGVSFQQVQKYEKGTNRVGSGRLQQIADALETTVSFFYEGQPGKHGVTTANDVSRFLTIPDGIAIAQAFMSIPEGSKLRRNMRDVMVGVADCCGGNIAKSTPRRAA